MDIMTTTFLQQHATQTATSTTSPAAAAAAAAMAWSNEKLRFSCMDSNSLRQLWKLLVLDTTSATNNSTNSNKTNNKQQNAGNSLQQQKQQKVITNNNNNFYANNEKINHMVNCENIAEYLTNRNISPTNQMSLLKFLAINALELSAPATPVLLQQNQQTTLNSNDSTQPQGWMQLSGHPESIVPTSVGIVRKRVANFTDSEVVAYQLLSRESQTSKIVPKFYGTLQIENDKFIELQDLLSGFKDPCVMDIKMGCRTFLESEVTNKTMREDLYKKMVAVDPSAPSSEEHECQSITKLRYMLFREAMSSSHAKGFRIEALRLRGRNPVKDLKTVRSSDQISTTIEQFMGGKRAVQKELIKRLKHMRAVMEKSPFFQSHEVVGSSIFIVYDDDKVGAWIIDFAKSRALPLDMQVNHRTDWVPGNREEGLLKGMDELISAFEAVYARTSNSRKCLQI